ncbi:Zinc RING FYVE PHD-type [Cordyceps militaris]|uniref:Zinc RING FYVE PHD-type n=1 Tax=Cordyceps militaris TaxID=73501 RepID=A0A2H4SWA8_CORMI|nr:Zinc RING FYVE PHD-type [Cordyceps militaris]
MSLASASPRRASLDSDIILISTSPLSTATRTPHHHQQHRHHQALQPPATTTTTLPPARSSSPRHHAHVSSAPPNTHASPPSHLSNPLSPLPRRRRRHSPSQQQHRGATQPDLRIAGTSPSRTPPGATPYDEPIIFSELLRDAYQPLRFPLLRISPDDDLYQDDSYIDPHHAATTTTQTNEHCMGRANDAPDSPSQQLLAGPSANTTQNTDFSLPETQYSHLFNDGFDDMQGTDTAATSFSESMPPPPTLRRGPSDQFPPSPQRQRQGQTGRRREPKQEPIKPLGPNEDLFGDLVTVPPAAPKNVLDADDLITFDLTEGADIPPELRPAVIDNRVKIAAFQCAICMDDVAGLTVTYCGHLFCAQCLHHSLDVESTKGKCPMCRSKIDMKPRESYSSKTKGFWPLELKLMTMTRRGKRKADDISK